MQTRGTPLSQERRNETRSPADCAGRVWFGPQAARSAACTLHDLSCSGAKIEVNGVHELPERVAFAHRDAAALFLAVVKWRTGEFAGLSFAEGVAFEDCTRPPLDRLAAEWIAECRQSKQD